MGKLKDVYLIVNHYFVPEKGEKTNKKNYGETAKYKTMEYVVVSDKLKTKFLQESTLILNLTCGTVEKCRDCVLTEEKTQQLFEGYVNKYQNEISTFFKKFKANDLKEFMESINKKEPSAPDDWSESVTATDTLGTKSE